MRHDRLLIALMCGAWAAAATAQPAPPTVVPADGQLRPGEGYILVSWDESERYIDRPAFVHGRVVASKKTDTRCYLNFHEQWRTHFTATIDRRAFAEFPQSPENLFRGKQVVVHGLISGELGKPEMAVTSAEQIMLVPDGEQDLLAFVRRRYPGVRAPDDPRARSAARPGTDAVRVGTYNILNLFDEFDDPYRIDEIMKPKPRAELERVAARIRELDADVLALQEIENRFFLERFVRSFLPDMGYEHIVLFEGNNHRGIDCALLSRLPVGAVTSYRHLRFPGPDDRTHRFQRDLLKVRVQGPGDFHFDVFVVHLKSKYGGAEQSEPLRRAEAAQIRKIVDELLYHDPQARFVICGDFNDFWDSPSLKLIRGSGQTELTCPATKLDKSQQITYNREPYLSMIDFIVCSPAMRERYREGSYRILPGTVDNSGSDHNPVVAAFRTR